MRGSGVTRWERLRGPGRNWSKIPQLATVSCLQPAELLEAALILSHVLGKLPPSQPHESQRSVGRSKALLLPGSCLRDASCQKWRLGTGGPRHSPFWEQRWKEQKTIISSIGHQYPDPGSPFFSLSHFPDCPIFHLNSLGSGVSHTKRWTSRCPTGSPRRSQCLDIPLLLDLHALGALGSPCSALCGPKFLQLSLWFPGYLSIYAQP